MVEEYCPRSEIQKLEHELWNLTMQGSDIKGYTDRFNDLATLCPGMVTMEYKKIERYIWGLAPQIQGMVTASQPTTFESTKSIAFRLTDQAILQGQWSQKLNPARISTKGKPGTTTNRPQPRHPKRSSKPSMHSPPPQLPPHHCKAPFFGY